VGAALLQDPTPRVRLDQWLWAARWFKTRALAKRAVETGKVTVDGQRRKPSYLLRADEPLQIERAGEHFDIRVLALSDTRGPFETACRLYQESPDSITRREAARALRRAEHAGYQPPESKPDKRARRLIRALGDLDAL